MHPHINIAVRAARKAGDIIMRAYDRTDHLRIEEKGHNDFVSEVDRAAEAAIIEIIGTAYPNDSFLGEEGGEIIKADPTTMWIIDPLDGTLNFLHHFPNFTVSIAQRKNNRLEQGVVYDPVTQELFTATRGEGAMLNSKRMRVSERTSLRASLLSSNLPNKDGEKLPFYQRLVEKTLYDVAAFRRTGSTALDLAYVAAGFIDGFICHGFAPWDAAAGILLVREAGGLVVDFDGGEDMIGKQTLLAGNPKIVKSLLSVIQNLK
jgi:myo-inositol-1(or 4)-monophosphatase